VPQVGSPPGRSEQDNDHGFAFVICYRDGR
jgi:hypothetical protein